MISITVILIQLHSSQKSIFYWIMFFSPFQLWTLDHLKICHVIIQNSKSQITWNYQNPMINILEMFISIKNSRSPILKCHTCSNNDFFSDEFDFTTSNTRFDWKTMKKYKILIQFFLSILDILDVATMKNINWNITHKTDEAVDEIVFMTRVRGRKKQNMREMKTEIDFNE